jgi:hypothetical protein
MNCQTPSAPAGDESPDVDQVFGEMGAAQVREDHVAVAALRDQPALHDAAAARVVAVEHEVVDEGLRPLDRQIGELELVEPRRVGPELARPLDDRARRWLEPARRGGTLVEPRARAGGRKRFELELAEQVSRARAALVDGAAANRAPAVELLRQHRLAGADRRHRLRAGADRRVRRIRVSHRTERDPQHEAASDGRSWESFGHVLKDRRRDEASPSFQVWFWPEDTSVHKQC